MDRTSLLVAAVAAMLTTGSQAWGQNLLDRLEKRVEKAIDRGAPRVTPAADDAAAPAAAGADELPAPAERTSGYLGVGLDETDAGAIVVTEIAPDSPAEKAGLKVGDTITAVNRRAVQDIQELGAVMEPVAPGEKLTLGVRRAGKDLTLVATLAEPPAPVEPEPGAAPSETRTAPRVELGDPLGPGGDLPLPAVPGPSELPRAGATTDRASLGVTVVTFNEETRRDPDVPVRSGALITHIRPQSPADRAGLPVGGVIVRFNGSRIETADELVEAIAAARPGDEVELSYYQGSRLASKDVMLTAAADPSLLAPGAGAGLRDRPLLNRVERALEGLARPGVGPPGAADPPAVSDIETALREEIDSLKAKIESLESRLLELEEKVAAPPAAADAPVEIPPAEAAPRAAAPAGGLPAPTLRPPTGRPPTTPKLKVKD